MRVIAKGLLRNIGILPALKNFSGFNVGRKKTGSSSTETFPVKADGTVALEIRPKPGIFGRLVPKSVVNFPASAMTAGALIMLNAMPAVAEDGFYSRSGSLPENPVLNSENSLILLSLSLNALSIFLNKRISIFTCMSTFGIIWSYCFNQVVFAPEVISFLAVIGFFDSNDGNSKSKQKKQYHAEQKT